MMEYRQEKTALVELPKPKRSQCCPECGSRNLIRDYNTSEIVCKDCALVLVTQIPDGGPEWRAFDEYQRMKRVRTGAPLIYRIHDKGLSTIIDQHDRDIYGKNLSSEQRAEFYRLRKWQKRMGIAARREESLAIGLSEISNLSDDLHLPKNVVETASIIYRKAWKELLTRGRKLKSIATASGYLACKQCGVPRTIKEFHEASGIPTREILRSYNLLLKELNYSAPVTKPEDYVSKALNMLEMYGKVEEIVYKILRASREAKLISGKSLTGKQLLHVIQLLYSQVRGRHKEK